MNKAWKAIVLQEIKEQFPSEESFYERHLGMDGTSWIRWKKDESDLGNYGQEKIERLFTDYEKMLVDKVARNAEIIPDVQMNPVREYKQMKFQIASKWIQSGLGEATWISDEDDFREKEYRISLLRVENDYQFWSYKDRLEFRIKESRKKQLRWSKPELLEWFEEKISEQKEEATSAET